MIRAFAIRTASVLGVCFFECGAFVSVSAVGIMPNCVGAIELSCRGCTFMGPADVGLHLGITDNAVPSSSFDGAPKTAPRDPASCCYRETSSSFRGTLVMHQAPIAK
jgi:hypothetical protein